MLSPDYRSITNDMLLTNILWGCSGSQHSHLLVLD